MKKSVLEYFKENAGQIKHIGFCMGEFEVSCLQECAMCEDCLKLYEKERSIKNTG